MDADCRRDGGSLLGFGAGMVDLVAPVSWEELARTGLRRGDAAEVSAGRMEAILSGLGRRPAGIPGGAAANTLRAFAGLGGRAALLSRFGGDGRGRLLREHLRASGVDVSRVRTAAGEATGCCLALVTPDCERTMCTMQGAFAGISPGMFSAADFAGHTHFYLEGYGLRFPGTALRALRLAREAGLCVCLDLGSPAVVRGARGLLREVLEGYVDVVFANEAENREFLRDGGPGLGSLCRIAVVKAGAAGARIMSAGGGELFVPAERAEVVDTTGAGDYWAAGFLSRWMRDGDLREAGRLAAAAAAAVVGVAGADLPMERLERMRRDFHGRRED